MTHCLRSVDSQPVRIVDADAGKPFRLGAAVVVVTRHPLVGLEGRPLDEAFVANATDVRLFARMATDMEC